MRLITAAALDSPARAEPPVRSPVVDIDARALFARGGGIHCITQQEPRPDFPARW